MQPCHARAVAELEKVTFSSPWSEKALIDSLDKGIFLVYEKDGQVLGYAGAYSAGDEAAVTNIAVFPEYKRQGIGEALTKELIKRAALSGKKTVCLEVRVSNSPAISLYEKLGFKTAGKRRGFYSNPREDAFIMIYETEDTP